jgi:hypothetical protein
MRPVGRFAIGSAGAARGECSAAASRRRRRRPRRLSGARAVAARARLGGDADARRVRRGVSHPARRRAGDGREAALAAREGRARIRRSPAEPASLARDRRVADDDPGRAPLRSNPGAPPGTCASGQLGTTRRQPGQARGREPATAVHREAAVRIMGRAARARRQTRPTLRLDGALRRGDRAPTRGVARARAPGHRPRGRGRLRSPHAPKRPDQVAEDKSKRACRSPAGDRARRLDALPPNTDCPLLFPSAGGNYVDLHNFRNRNWKPAQKAAGITPRRRVYDLRHTFATSFAPESPPSTSPATWEQAWP